MRNVGLVFIGCFVLLMASCKAKEDLSFFDLPLGVSMEEIHDKLTAAGYEMVFVTPSKTGYSYEGGTFMREKTNLLFVGADEYGRSNMILLDIVPKIKNTGDIYFDSWIRLIESTQGGKTTLTHNSDTLQIRRWTTRNGNAYSLSVKGDSLNYSAMSKELIDLNR